MAVFKCKMCGGVLEITNETVATCEYCGTQQTLPKLDDDRRANLYDRANHFRRNNEFDKAMGIYDQILNEDKTDAEAYWSLVLCRYGIEYVEDPSTHKRIPTVNRAQFTSVFDDDNYKSALQYADSYQRSIYEEEAKTINEIQKGILAISQKEEPFDVFICYKESDNNGRRTPDSVLAQDLYYQLKQEGFKVFFSRITLEDKLGSAYEPYIFAALNSSKVMVVLGTKPEFFNAVWVKNEWSRYLALIKNGAKKMLIPAYKDMDPYDLPEEFSHLQAQDMSKLGFMQDLIRGIKKIISADEPKATVVKETIISGGNANTAPLLKRAFLFLEDGDWVSADEYCEKVLDIDPENASAYIGKLMAEFQVKTQDSLKDLEYPFDNNNNYQKAIRFADDELKITLTGYIDFINTRNENARLEGIYQGALIIMNSAKSEFDFKKAAEEFSYALGYKDTETLQYQCLEKAENARKDEIYNNAIEKEECNSTMLGSITMLNRGIELFKQIPGWRDADEQIIRFQEKIAKLEQEEKEKQIANAKKAKRIGMIAGIILVVIALIIIIALLVDNVFIPNSKYNNAVALMNEGKYVEAISSFEALNGHKDSEIKINECNTAIKEEKYNDAVALMNEGKYAEAITAFEALNGHKDSRIKIDECNTAIKEEKYNKAIALMEAGNIDEAHSIFNELGDYKNASDKAREIQLTKTKAQLKSIKAGSYIKFGVYEQDNNISNGKEAVEWLVLEVKDGKALVISKYALDCKTYNTSYTDVTWETCTLRKWLNNDFINATFSADEKTMIPTVTVSADKAPDYSTNPGNATQDQVFLLSSIESNKYFSSDSARRCKATNYAVANGAWESFSGDGCWWWLRSPGYSQRSAAYIGDITYGGVDYDYGSYDVDRVGLAVRPALWLDINAQ